MGKDTKIEWCDHTVNFIDLQLWDKQKRVR